MDAAERDCRKLGQRSAHELDRLGLHLNLEQGRHRFLEQAARKGRSRAPLWIAAAAVLTLIAGFLWLGRPRPMHFEVGVASPGSVGAWIAAPPSESLPVQFSDGSMLRLEAGSRARVVEIGPRTAHVVLERGHIEARVIHRPATRWTVSVGPFDVLVTGTRFHAMWDPLAERFTLQMIDGSVTVSGPGVRGRPVVGGERLSVQGYDQGTQQIDYAATPVASALPTHQPPASSSPSVTDSSPAPVRDPAPGPTWIDLAGAGRHHEAMEAVERQGFEVAVREASEHELSLLADCARFAGRPSKAAQALEAMRRRFPGSPRASNAAFLLGKLHADQLGSPASAATWFERYVAEQPRGPFAREAEGRIIETRKSAGDHLGSRRAARQYLRHYPAGPHAALAKQILFEGGDDEP